jgi:hypothetical protein
MNNKTNKLQIQIPEGYVVDTENSDLVNGVIKFKPIVKRWRDDESQLIDGYFIHSPNSDISGVYNMVNSPWNHNVFAEEKQAKSALAMARISQIMKNDERFGGVVTDEEWDNVRLFKYVIYRVCSHIETDDRTMIYKFLAFHTEEQRDLFLKENEDLVKDYLMIP